MTLATETTAASSYANVLLHEMGCDSSAEVILGKAACVEST